MKFHYLFLLMVLTIGKMSSIEGADLTFYSQCGQDKYLYNNFFKNKKNGVFVDIGAHDGITHNNTYFFEKNLEWKGICIEPIPEVFEKLKNSRKVLCIQGCISDKYKVAHFLRVKGYPEMLSGILENYDPRHLARIQKEIELYGGSSEVILIPCYRINELLKENGLTYVDYLSLDIEGGELEVLKSIDYNAIYIDMIDVENNYGDPRFKQFLERKGYKLIAVIGAQDEIYKKIK